MLCRITAFILPLVVFTNCAFGFAPQLEGTPDTTGWTSAQGVSPGYSSNVFAASPVSDTRTQSVFFNYDHLLFTLGGSSSSLIGDSSLEGTYVRGGVATEVRNSLSTSFIDQRFDSAHRIEFGSRGPGIGWLLGLTTGDQDHTLNVSGVTFLPQDPGATDITRSFFAGYADGNEDGIDDDLNRNNVYGRDGRDLGTPDPAGFATSGAGVFVPPFDGIVDTPAGTDTGDLQYFFPVFDNVRISNRVEIDSYEAMVLKPLGLADSSDLMFGLRYFRVDETFSFDGSGGLLDSTNFIASSQNRIIGPQIGLRYRTLGFFGCQLSAEGRFVAGWNISERSLSGSLGSNLNAEDTRHNVPVRLEPSSFSDQENNTDFIAMGEVRVNAVFPLTEIVSANFGYTGIFAPGISRASNSIRYTMPAFGLNSGGSDTLGIHALNFGLSVAF